MDMNNIINNLDSSKYKTLLNLTSEKITTITQNVLNNLNIDNSIKNAYTNKLNNYKYIYNLEDLNVGSYIKSISIETNKLNNASILCDITINDNGILLTCKNFKNQYFSINMEMFYIFQKITLQESIILNALDHIQTSNNNSNYTTDDSNYTTDDELSIHF